MLNDDWKYDKPRKEYYFNDNDLAEHDSELLEDVWKKVISKDEDYLYLSEIREIIAELKAEVSE